MVNAAGDYKTLRFCSAERAAPGAGLNCLYQMRQDNLRKSSVHILSNCAQLRNSTTQIRFERHNGTQQAEDAGLSLRLLSLSFSFFFQKPQRLSYRLTRLWEKKSQRETFWSSASAWQPRQQSGAVSPAFTSWVGTTCVGASERGGEGLHLGRGTWGCRGCWGGPN